MGPLFDNTEESVNEWNVLVTGFGPFLNNDVNPSFLIAKSLPSRHITLNHPVINIHAYPTPINVSYIAVRQLVPSLLFPNNNSSTISRPQRPSSRDHMPDSSQAASPAFDLNLHIGMASGRSYYTLETLAHRDGYTKPDIDKNTMTEDTYWHDTYSAPEKLEPTFDTTDVWRRWKSGLTDEDLRPSNDAGHYLCDFTYYTSMVEYWRRDPDGVRPCMFLHVPGDTDPESLDTGRRVALGLIGALVSSETAKKKEEGNRQ